MPLPHHKFIIMKVEMKILMWDGKSFYAHSDKSNQSIRKVGRTS